MHLDTILVLEQKPAELKQLLDNTSREWIRKLASCDASDVRVAYSLMSAPPVRPVPEEVPS